MHLGLDGSVRVEHHHGVSDGCDYFDFNVAQSRVILEKESSAVKMPLSNGSIGKAVVHIFDLLMNKI